MATKSPAATLRPTSHNLLGYRRLSAALDLPRSALAILAIDPNATIAGAERVIREQVGPRAWRAMQAATSAPARASAALAGLRAMRAADREPVEPALRRAGSGESAPPCESCGHPANLHPDGGRCDSTGCRCAEYQESEEPADPNATTRPKRQDKPHADPKREDMIGRVAATTGRTRAEVAASMSALGLGATPVARASATPARASTTPAAATVTDADRRVAAAGGYDPADVARSRAALGFKVAK